MHRLIYFIPLLVFLFSCEEEVDIEVPEADEKLAVEGYIENNRPPFVVITRTSPYFSTLSAQQIEDSFVRNAEVTISNGIITWPLFEVSSDVLLFLLRGLEEVLGVDINLNRFLGYDIESLTEDDPTFYFYTNLALLGRELETYDLRIEVDGEVITSTTTIPKNYPLDSLWVTPHPNEAFDSLVLLNARFTDPANEDNYVRYFTNRGSEPYYPGFFQSVFDDKSLFDLDGEQLDFSLERGYGFVEEIDFDVLSYFVRGDTIRVRWCAIDKAHYDFWNTLEFDRTQAGNPFGRPSIIKSNIKGGVGYWGGYSASYHELITEPIRE